MGAVIHDDFWAAAQAMPEKQRAEFIYAICAYSFDGIEPTGAPAWLPTFIVIRDRINMGSKASERGRAMANARWGDKHDAQASDKHDAQASDKHDAQASDKHDAQAYAQASDKHDAQASDKHDAEKEDEVEYEVEYEKEREKYKEELPSGSSKKKRPRFSAPSVDEVSEYAEELGFSGFDALRFIDYYESNGWKVGRNPMRDWRAAVRNWARKDAPKDGGGYIADYD